MFAGDFQFDAEKKELMEHGDDDFFFTNNYAHSFGKPYTFVESGIVGGSKVVDGTQSVSEKASAFHEREMAKLRALMPTRRPPMSSAYVQGLMLASSPGTTSRRHGQPLTIQQPRC